MSKIRIIAFGKAKKSDYQNIIAEYAKRLQRDLVTIEINQSSGSKAEIIKQESQKLLKYIAPENYKVFLDGDGKSYDSREFSSKIFQGNNKNIDFFIGGSHGFSHEILSKADLCLSLSKMTLPHMLARLFLLEQIYRAKMIQQKHPYHK